MSINILPRVPPPVNHRWARAWPSAHARRTGVNATTTEPGVRQSRGALAAWHGWQHGSDDRAADSTTVADYCAYMLALQQQQQARTRGGVAAILRELRPALAENLEAPGNGQAGGQGELAGPGGELVGLMGCKEGNRPLLPYPRASLTTSRPRRHCPRCSCRIPANLTLADPSRPRFVASTSDRSIPQTSVLLL